MVPAATLLELCAFDTPTVCNALEAIDPDRRNFGYTVTALHCVNPDSSPVVGYARTATVRSVQGSELDSAALKAARVDYYRYVAEPADLPKVVVMQDLDGKQAGRGPFWGEFNTRIHGRLNVVGVVTDNTVRDLRNLPGTPLILSAGLRPSHANIHVVGFGEQVNVSGMYVRDGELVHADEHGAVTFQEDLAYAVVREAKAFVDSERPIIEGCKRNKLDIEQIIQLYMQR
jgi:regulator of RNase E activity RraA